MYHVPFGWFKLTDYTRAFVKELDIYYRFYSLVPSGIKLLNYLSDRELKLGLLTLYKAWEVKNEIDFSRH